MLGGVGNNRLNPGNKVFKQGVRFVFDKNPKGIYKRVALNKDSVEEGCIHRFENLSPWFNQPLAGIDLDSNFDFLDIDIGISIFPMPPLPFPSRQKNQVCKDTNRAVEEKNGSKQVHQKLLAWNRRGHMSR